jgi:NADH pyrophosphatase NudC (nudix superfamily)
LNAGSDAADVRWFTREELPALKLAHDANDVALKGLARVGLKDFVRGRQDLSG